MNENPYDAPSSSPPPRRNPLVLAVAASASLIVGLPLTLIAAYAWLMIYRGHAGDSEAAFPVRAFAVGFTQFAAVVWGFIVLGWAVYWRRRRRK